MSEDLHPSNHYLPLCLGDALVVVAQVVVAIQMVVEQKLLAGCDVPALFAVGLEGLLFCCRRYTDYEEE